MLALLHQRECKGEVRLGGVASRAPCAPQGVLGVGEASEREQEPSERELRLRRRRRERRCSLQERQRGGVVPRHTGSVAGQRPGLG